MRWAIAAVSSSGLITAAASVRITSMPAGSKPAMAWVFVCWCLCLPARSTATRADQLWRPLGEPTQFWAGVFHFCTRRVLVRVASVGRGGWH